MSLHVTIAAPFRHTRKEHLKKNEIVYYLAFDRKWMTIEQANQVLARAVEDGLLVYEGDMIRPGFDISSIDVPLGFKPSSSIFERSDPYQELLNRIVKATGKELTVLVSEMNTLIRDGFDGNIRPEAAAVILAREYTVPFEDVLPALREHVLKKD